MIQGKFYSRWHPISTDGHKTFDINIAKKIHLVYQISDSLVMIFTEIDNKLELPDNCTDIDEYKIWDGSNSIKYLYDAKTSKFYIGCPESISFQDDGSIIFNGMYGIINDTKEEAIIESYFKIREFVPSVYESQEVNRDYSKLKNFLTEYEDYVSNLVPERMI
jgi:hypothetical protein